MLLKTTLDSAVYISLANIQYPQNSNVITEKAPNLETCFNSHKGEASARDF